MKYPLLTGGLVSALLFSATGWAEEGTDAVADTLRALDATAAMGSPAELTCSREPAKRSESACKLAFDERCERFRADKTKNPAERGFDNIRDAVGKALKEAGVKDLAGLAAKHFEAIGFSINPEAFANRDVFNQLLFDAWYRTSYGADETPMQKARKLLVPPEFLNCQKSEDSPLKKYRLLAERSRYSQMRTLIKIALSRQETATIYDDLRSKCERLKSSGQAPPECDEQALDQLRLEVLTEFAERANTDGSHGALDGIKLKERLVDAIQKMDLWGKEKQLPYLELDVDDIPKFQMTSVAKDEHREYAQYCESAESDYEYAIERELQKLRGWISQSKPVVRALENKYFNDENFSKMNSLIDGLKDDAVQVFRKEIVPMGCLSKEKADQVATELKNLLVYREAPIPDSTFVKDAEAPLPYYHSDLFPADRMATAELAFADAGLGAFTALNAHYEPKSVAGAQNKPEHIAPEAVMFDFLKELPGTVKQIMAHEVAHKLGPDTSAVNGYDLTACYAKLLGCFKKQFNLQPNQADEAFADWFSAKINGARIARISDPEAVEIALDQFVAGKCLYDQKNSNCFDCTHPHPAVRANYILGRDPKIRKALGCPPGPHCELTGEHSGDCNE